MDDDFDTFLSLLRRGCSDLGAEYFQMPQADSDSVYRERVYCYELYHRIRASWGALGYTLGGEVDKNGHAFFRETPFANAKPDFLVHDPGSMNRNLAVVEVKSATSDTASVIEDLEKLSWFCDNAGYYGGIQVIYGSSWTSRRNQALAAWFKKKQQNIILLWHEDVGAEPRVPFRISR